MPRAPKAAKARLKFLRRRCSPMLELSELLERCWAAVPRPVTSNLMANLEKAMDKASTCEKTGPFSMGIEGIEGGIVVATRTCAEFCVALGSAFEKSQGISIFR